MSEALKLQEVPQEEPQGSEWEQLKQDGEYRVSEDLQRHIEEGTGKSFGEFMKEVEADSENYPDMEADQEEDDTDLPVAA